MADVLLFGGEDRPRILLNIGGMANLTYVPQRAVERGAFAFDTGPGMTVIDGIARRIDPTLGFDLDGRLAAQGVADEALLVELLSDPFFHQEPPKSTGRERFGSDYADRLHARAGRDAVTTAAHLTARSIAEAIGRWTRAGVEVVGSGGGCRHPVLWELLRSRLVEQGRTLLRFDDLFFSGDAKEAVAFALLGYLTVHGQPGNLPAATGARGQRVLGMITPA
jgi:anhydro-N-acetylmuramic acid kinase